MPRPRSGRGIRHLSPSGFDSRRRPMDTPAELPPGCLVLLLRLSAGMDAARVSAQGGDEWHEDVPAFAAARQLADELVEYLVGLAADGSAGPLDIAVLGYQTAE